MTYLTALNTVPHFVDIATLPLFEVHTKTPYVFVTILGMSAKVIDNSKRRRILKTTYEIRGTNNWKSERGNRSLMFHWQMMIKNRSFRFRIPLNRELRL